MRPGWWVLGAVVVLAAGTGATGTDLLRASETVPPVTSAPSSTWPGWFPVKGALPPALPDVTAGLQRDLGATPGAYGGRRGARFWTASIPDARWNPCEPLRFLINPDGAPDGALEDFRAAVYKVDQATGLTLEIVGTTDTIDPGWADEPGNPVLVNWGSPGHGVLEPGAAGTAEPVAWMNQQGARVYAGGQLTFNIRADWQYIPGAFALPGSRIALYMHELAHIVGLGHVPDRRQLMYRDTFAGTDFGAGDLAGLADLSSDTACLDPPQSATSPLSEPAG